jgi:hypothetical protein
VHAAAGDEQAQRISDDDARHRHRAIARSLVVVLTAVLEDDLRAIDREHATCGRPRKLTDD